MLDSVAVTIEVKAAAAAALNDPATRARIGRLVGSTLGPTSVDRLIEAMDAILDEARRRGLTDEMREAELAAHNAEHRDRPPAV